MKIHMPEIIEDKENVMIRVLVEFHEYKKHLWYSISREYKEWLTPERQDAFVTALLPLAMKEKEDIYVEGVMSEKLYYNLVNYYMPIISLCNPALSQVRIFPEELRTTTYAQAKGVATGFSGGIDSFCVIADHFFGSVPKGFKITHLLFNNVGSHGAGGRQLFQDRYNRLMPAAKELGLDFIAIDSNISQVVPVSFRKSHTIRNISAVLLLQKLIRRFYYASAFKYEDCFVGETDYLGHTDPMAVHLLSTETTECISSGCQYSRVEKTMRVAEIPLSNKYLDVCVDTRGGKNCSACFKCARTLVTLDVIGKSDEFKEVFDLKKYAIGRNRHIGKILSRKLPLSREIVQKAKELKYEFPLLSKCYALLYAPSMFWESKKIKGTIPYRVRRMLKNFKLKGK
jgi:hypothetical protein